MDALSKSHLSDLDLSLDFPEDTQACRELDGSFSYFDSTPTAARSDCSNFVHVHFKGSFRHYKTSNPYPGSQGFNSTSRQESLWTRRIMITCPHSDQIAQPWTSPRRPIAVRYGSEPGRLWGECSSRSIPYLLWLLIFTKTDVTRMEGGLRWFGGTSDISTSLSFTSLLLRDTSFKNGTSPLVVCLPHLHTLQLLSDVGSILALVAHLSLPRLTSLVLSMRSSNVPEVKSSDINLSRLDRLCRLELELFEDSWTTLHDHLIQSMLPPPPRDAHHAVYGEDIQMLHITSPMRLWTSSHREP